MATLQRDNDGKVRILFVGQKSHGAKRHTVRLGDVDDKTARTFKENLEDLIKRQKAGVDPTAALQAWLNKLPDGVLTIFAAAGLVEFEERHEETLGPFIKAYIARRGDVKPSTGKVFGRAQKALVAHFGAGKPLREITKGDAKAYRSFLAGSKKLADNTVRRQMGIAKQFFREALELELIDRNPFAGQVATVKGNAAREFYVTREMADKILEACPNNEARLVFAMARYAGLRMPSELLELRWSDVDWERGRFRVRSPKTEHHEGRESRLVPLFPELKGYLDRAWDELGDKPAEFIIRERLSHTHFRQRLERIIKAAGLTQWPKLFQNLRSTRQTELAEKYPLHVVCAWLGNTTAVASKHYLQLTDEHFTRAAAEKPAEAGKSAAQNPAQSDAASERTVPQTVPESSGNAKNTAFCSVSMGGKGLEPLTSTV